MNWKHSATHPVHKFKTSVEVPLEFMEHLRNVVSKPYFKKHGKCLSWANGWAWEALAFVDNELGRPKP